MEPLSRSPELMSRSDTGLLIIDMQERLLSHVLGYERILWNARRLVDGAKILGLPVAATEQYPQGLGGTVQELASRLPAPASKVAFSCGACPELFTSWQSGGAWKILLAGIEAHVCVQQTALDLVAGGWRVYVAADATGARGEMDYTLALRRMEAAGVTLTTTEAALFEWCQAAGTSEFKLISQLVREAPPITVNP